MSSRRTKPPYVFLFDIDGTLLASSGAGKAALEESFLNQYGLPEIQVHVPYSGRTDLAIVRDLMTSHGITPTDEGVTRLQQAYLKRLPETLRRLNGRVLPGVTELLNRLNGHNEAVLIGLLTGNIRQGAAVKLQHFQLEHHFVFGGYGDQFLDRDDVARSAWAAAETHHGGTLAPERTWVIGDTPLDVVCARAIGAKVAAVATGYFKVEELAEAKPDLVFPTLDEAGALERMLAA
jgi:phosphoglycolate phosphatase-like HAD superfamily hydrolase